MYPHTLILLAALLTPILAVTCFVAGLVIGARMARGQAPLPTRAEVQEALKAPEPPPKPPQEERLPVRHA